MRGLYHTRNQHRANFRKCPDVLGAMPSNAISRGIVLHDHAGRSRCIYTLPTYVALRRPAGEAHLSVGPAQADESELIIPRITADAGWHAVVASNFERTEMF